jgi:hypothetical protein
MSQNDYTIANQTTPLFRADLNSALQALASNSSGATEPATTYANMFWYDTEANTLYMRSEADDVWITIGVLNQSTSKFEVEDYLGFTPVQQGGGAGQLSNKVYIGWSGSELKAQVDASDRGAIAFKSDIPAGYSDAQARAAQAGHAVGGIGSYVLGAAEVSLAAGATVAGSSVRPAGAYSDSAGSNTYTTTVGSVLSGTWRCMGVNTTSGNFPLTLYLRIS